MAGHVEALSDELQTDELLLHAAMARLENPGAMDIATNAVQLRVVASLKAVNTIKGGLLALTDRRLVYLGRTLVGQDHLRQGNELISIPLEAIVGVASKRGKGRGDVRKIASITLYGSKLRVELDGAVQEFIEIKPLDTASQTETAIRTNTGPVTS